MGQPAVVTLNCTCSNPIPVVRAERKGAALTVCDRCGLPIRLDFGTR